MAEAFNYSLGRKLTSSSASSRQIAGNGMLQESKLHWV